MSHENTARFIGACVNCPLVFVLTEYCPKGSLKDVLSKDELQLDLNFRTSLVNNNVQVRTTEERNKDKTLIGTCHKYTQYMTII